MTDKDILGRPVDVVVVGAGLAGLASATHLVKAGHDVAVVEARSDVGGRARTVTVPTAGGRPGIEIDLGAQWVSRDQRRVMALARELGLATVATSPRGEVVTELDGRLVRSRGQIPRPAAGVVVDVGVCAARLGWIARRVPLDRPWAMRDAEQLDATPFDTWLAQVARTDAAHRLLRGVVEAGICASTTQVSVLEVAHQMKSVGGWRGLAAADSRWLPAGSGALSVGLARRLGERVLVDSPVRSIHVDATGVDIVIDGGHLRCRRVVLALAPQVAAQLQFDPPLPVERLDSLTDRVLGSVTKTVIGYRDAWWRRRGLNGTASPETGPIDLLTDVSTGPDQLGILVALSTGPTAARTDLSNSDRSAQAVGVVERMLGAASSAPLFVETLRWDDEATALGGYASRYGVGGWTRHGAHWRSPVGRLHFAGTETAGAWRSYMEGALDSAARVAAEVELALATGADG